MRLFPLPASLVLYSDFSPEECSLRVGDSIDIDTPTVFGFSGYRGSKPFVGRIDGKQFRLIQRVYRSRNVFPTVFAGEFQPEGEGTRVSGEFDLEQTAKIAICLFGVLGLFLLVFIAVFSWASHPALTLIFVCGYGGLLFFSPRIFRSFGSDEQNNITQFLNEILVTK